MMEEKKVEISGSSSLRKPQTKKPTKRLTKLITRRGSVNNRYTRQENKIIVNENKDEEDDKSNYDPDKDILKRFLDEQKKERDDFVKVVEAGKVNTRKSVVTKK